MRGLIFILMVQCLLFRDIITKTTKVDTKDLDHDDNDSKNDDSELEPSGSGDDSDEEQDDDDDDDNDDDNDEDNNNKLNSHRQVQAVTPRISLRSSFKTSDENDRNAIASYSRRSSRRYSSSSSYGSRHSRNRYDDSRQGNRSNQKDARRRSGYAHSDRSDSYERDSRGGRGRSDRYRDRDNDRRRDRDRYGDSRSDRYMDGKKKYDREDDRGYSHGQRRSSKREKLRRAPVLMPSGQLKNITIPTDSKKWKCGWRSKMFTLSPDGRTGKIDYDIVKDEMEASWSQKPFTSQIIKIEKIVSTCLWNRYKYRKRQVIDEARAANERMLFFGAAAPTILQLTQRGFDERNLTMTSTSWGAGFILPEHSDQAHGYTSVQPDGNRLMLLCRVTLGTTEVYATGANMAHPPVGFQSVKGTVNTQSVYVVYRGEQIYPEYLITYK